MSFLVKPVELNFLNNKDRENVHLTDDGDGSFNFKYVSTSQIEHIIKDVRRERTRKREESVWASYLRNRKFDCFDCDKNDYAIPGISNVKQMLRDSMEEVDQELMRLKEDALPERKKRISKNYPLDQTKKEERVNKEKSSNTLEQPENFENGSGNILLAIPEENKTPSVDERSPISKLEYSTRTRKSHSERTLRPKNESEERFHRPVKHSEYDYSSGRSRDYDSDNKDTYDVRPHPLIAHKILSMQKKVSKLLDEISFRLVRIPLPDGDRDLRRRQQCVMEFAIRFSRNYLYDLGRQIGDIQRHVRAISPTARTKASQRGLSLHMQAIEQKLISAHQLLLHALNAYCKHIPSSVLRGHPGKLKEILQYVVDLNDVCTKIDLTTDYYECGDIEPPPLGNDTENRCGAILSQLRSSDSDSLLVSHTTQSTPIELLRNKTINDNRKDLPVRLSMYNANLQTGKNFGNRKNVATFARGKKSSLGARRNSSHCKTSIPEQPNSSPVTNKSSKIIAKRSRTKIRGPVKEDDINTMMSMIPTDSDAGSSIAVFGESQPSGLIHHCSTTRGRSSRKSPSDAYSPSSITARNEKLETDGDDFGNVTNLVSEKQLSNLVPVIADLMTLVRNERQSDLAIQPVPSNSMDALMDLLEKYRISKNEDISNLETSGLPVNTENSGHSENKPMETRSGAKNMQLICLPAVEISQGNTMSVDRTGHVVNETKVSTGTSSLSGIRKLRVDESSLGALLKYRDDYRNWSRSNPMYTSKSRNKPWDVVTWIADKLVDELIVDVSKEFYNFHNELVQKLFQLEFKEF